MRIAVVGAGVSGLVAAAGLTELGARYEVTVFEAAGHLGGHARTVEVEHAGRTVPVDTGFMVFNEVTYPELTRLFGRLGVATRPSDMSFSVANGATGLEYCGTSLATLFAQPGNLVRPAFLGMLAEIVRFNRRAPELARRRPEITLGELLAAGGFGPYFRDNYLVPMTAAVWSATPEGALEMPASFLIRFFSNHGMLSVDGHFQWRTVVGGSARYVEALSAPFRHRVRLDSPIARVERVRPGPSGPGGVRVVPVRGAPDLFDRVVLALHADQALALLAEPTRAEREVLGAFPYQRNEGVLHTDLSVLPRAPRARASWNYRVPGPAGPAGSTGSAGSGNPARLREPQGAAVTYDLSRLQGLPGLPDTDPLLLTLNRTGRVDPRTVLRSFTWTHPVYTLGGVAAQGRRHEVSGVDRIHYCGAYWRNGFHEDGVVSALEAVREITGREIAGGAVQPSIRRLEPARTGRPSRPTRPPAPARKGA
ncbi:MAG: FAD-dependent oxidoreductase [Acidobacteriota bacterium]